MEQDNLFAPLNEETCTPMNLALASVPSFEEDFLAALRFLYYVRAKPAVPDNFYDRAEKDLLSRSEPELLMQPGSDSEEDYPDHIKALSIYIQLARHDYYKRNPPIG